ncbi:hypothetical protein ZWY2020_027073 [Hordeum vulgare]|nr:hypothetical protein ZWY2020_027073 [Hordeum vulgare]
MYRLFSCFLKKSRSATKANAARAGTRTTPVRSLPEEIVVWEILVRLPPKSLLRCRAVCRAWHHATSTRSFLLAHHARQPSLPIVRCTEYSTAPYPNIYAFDHLYAFDHRAAPAAAAQLQSVVRLDRPLYLAASCDGLLILSQFNLFWVCNPATRECAHIPYTQTHGYNLLGMYFHQPTGGYRLLLHNSNTYLPPEYQVGCYIFTLGSDRPLRYIGSPGEAKLERVGLPVVVRDSLHWYTVHSPSGSKLVLAFDFIGESFRQMRAPDCPTGSCIFEMDDTLGIYSYTNDLQIVVIWVLRNYESEIWENKYQVELPVSKIGGRFGSLHVNWHVNVVWVDGDVLLLVTYGGWLFYIDISGELLVSFHCDGERFNDSKLKLKQSLVRHNFFTALDGYDVNTWPFN